MPARREKRRRLHFMLIHPITQQRQQQQQQFAGPTQNHFVHARAGKIPQHACIAHSKSQDNPKRGSSSALAITHENSQQIEYCSTRPFITAAGQPASRESA